MMNHYHKNIIASLIGLVLSSSAFAQDFKAYDDHRTYYGIDDTISDAEEAAQKLRDATTRLGNRLQNQKLKTQKYIHAVTLIPVHPDTVQFVSGGTGYDIHVVLKISQKQVAKYQFDDQSEKLDALAVVENVKKQAKESGKCVIFPSGFEKINASIAKCTGSEG